jgi:hypothetical protein
LKQANPARILCHVKELPLFSVAFRRPSGYYLALNTLAQRDSGSHNNLQTCFANKDKLKHYKSLKPIPPLSFGIHSFHHAFQCICLGPYRPVFP